MSNNKTPMTPAAAARIQSAEAKQNGGRIEKGGFAARALSAAAQNTNVSQSTSKPGKTPPPNGPSKTGNKSGGDRGNNPSRPKHK